MDILSEIIRDMAFMGWKGEGRTGFSHKEDADGNRVALSHDGTWRADFEEATARAERTAIIRELERRDRAAS